MKKRSAEAAPAPIIDQEAALIAFREKIKQQTAQIAAKAKKSRWSTQDDSSPIPRPTGTGNYFYCTVTLKLKPFFDMLCFHGVWQPPIIAAMKNIETKRFQTASG